MGIGDYRGWVHITMQRAKNNLLILLGGKVSQILRKCYQAGHAVTTEIPVAEHHLQLGIVREENVGTTDI